MTCDNNGNRVKQWPGPDRRDHQENIIKPVRSRKVGYLSAGNHVVLSLEPFREQVEDAPRD